MGSRIAPGTVVAGRYCVEKVLGEGKRKRTYLASDTHLPRSVALAVFKDSSTWSSGGAEGSEAIILGQIGGHDNIVTLYDRGSDGELHYLVFEYLPHGTLREACERVWEGNEQVKISDALRWFRQLSRALSHIHQRGVLHRDISPRNVWLDERDVAHLGDFDSAIKLGVPETLEPAQVTTEAYSSPEQARGDEVDLRSDLYSLGALFYEVSCGKRPRLSARTETPLLPPSHYRFDLPPRLDKLIMSLISYDPCDRPDSAEPLITRLFEIAKTVDLDTMISAGESDTVEFKSTFRFDLKEQRVKSERISDVTKAISAMLNTHGGVLLIGVDDEGSPIGLRCDLDSFDHDDKTLDAFERKLRSAVSAQIGFIANKDVGVSFPKYKGVQICRIDIQRSKTPAFVKRKSSGAEFYVRQGNASHPLTDLEDLYLYVSDRWGSDL